MIFIVYTHLYDTVNCTLYSVQLTVSSNYAVVGLIKLAYY